MRSFHAGARRCCSRRAPAPAARVGRWLSTPALVFVGLISYSLYPWHLPILAFAAYYNILPLEPRHLVVLLSAIFALAAVTWRYVEAPLRGRTVLASDARFLAAAAAATLAVAALGVFLWRSGDFAGRLDAADATLIGTTVERLRSDASPARTARCAMSPAAHCARSDPSPARGRRLGLGR